MHGRLMAFAAGETCGPKDVRARLEGAMSAAPDGAGLASVGAAAQTQARNDHTAHAPLYHGAGGRPAR